MLGTKSPIDCFEKDYLILNAIGEFNAEYEHIRMGVLNSGRLCNRNAVGEDTGKNSKWAKPPNGWLKCNVDAATFIQNRRMGTGMITRNSNAQFVAARRLPRGNFIGDALMAEAISLKEVLSWIKELQLENVIVETDALAVVNLLKGEGIIRSIIGLIIDDCKFLTNEITNCKISYVRRSTNHVAHLLLRVTGSISDLKDGGNIPHC
ncbi:hypothetical protein DITRI_Ditri03aG0150200 [Diplodiscus trichospermus]